MSVYGGAGYLWWMFILVIQDIVANVLLSEEQREFARVAMDGYRYL